MSARTLPARPDEASISLIVRSAAFNAAALIWTVALLVAALPVLLMPPAAILAVSRTWMRGVQFLSRHLIGLTYEVHGREHLPQGPAIYAFKHQSAWETLVCHLLVRNGAIALKQELVRIPVFGWYLRHSGMIGIDRSGGTRALRSLVEGARAAFHRGVSVIIFPEGHRTPPGDHRPYQPGVAALYTQLDRPVVPVAHNSGLFWGRRSFVKRPGRIVVRFLPPIEPGLTRKAFMAELQQRLEGACDRLIDEAGSLNPGRPR